MLRRRKNRLHFESLEQRLPLAGLAPECRLADVDDNHVVDRADVALVANNFGAETGKDSQGDTDGNSVVDVRDLMRVQAHFGTDCNGPPIRFAAFGDYGNDSPEEVAVANLVESWNPDFIITLGDNNYGVGAAETIDANIGKHYQQFIGAYAGAYGPGSPTNRFFPSLGNHDWWFAGADSIAPYLDYFDLPGTGFGSSSGNERYYDFVWGPVHFFAVNSSEFKPDGTGASSLQAAWLRTALAESTTPWQIVYFHESPYSSGSDSGSTTKMQWPFAAWGADLVLSAHDHNYERLFVGGITYLVAGTGGAPLRAMGALVPGSQVTYNEFHGALSIVADSDSLRAEFRSVADGETLVDCVALGSAIGNEPCARPDAPSADEAAAGYVAMARSNLGERIEAPARRRNADITVNDRLRIPRRRTQIAELGESSRGRLVATASRRVGRLTANDARG